MSRREYKTIRRRLVAGSDASRREGKYTGNVPPYGYARKKLKKEKGWTLEIIPDQAQVVRMIFDWYRNGMQGIPVGYTAISDELNRLSIPSPSGTRWTPNGIQGDPSESGLCRIHKIRISERSQEDRRRKAHPQPSVE